MGETKKNTESSGNSPLELHSADLANFGRSQTISLVSRPKFAENYESQTENPSVVLNANSTDSSLRGESMDSHESSVESNANSSIVSEKSGLCSHERGNKTKASIDEASGKLHDLSPQDEFAKTPKFRSVIVGASGLSLGISIVVAILLGIGAGILMQKIFGVFWVLFLGVFWGIAAAVLNVYKVYKAELHDFETLANDPKYKSTNPK